MAINWDSYEKKAKQITANAKQKSTKTYVGGKSASEVSGKNSNKNKNNKSNKNKTTTKLFPSKSEIVQGLGESAASINKLKREAEKAQEKAKKDGLKKLKKATERSASEIAEDLGNSIGEMHKQERAAKEKSREEKAKLKAKQRQAEEKTAEKKLATKSDKQANATAKREHRSTATKTGKKDIDAGTKRIIANTKPYAFISAAEDELANNSLLGIGYAWANGKKMANGGGQYDAYTTLDNAIKNRTIRKAGEMTGIGGSYLMSYGVAGAAAKAAAATNAGQKAIAKLAGSKLGQASASAAQNTITKLAGTKVGQRIGKETITGVARGAAKDFAGDVTVGTVMNSGQARSLGLEGWDFAGYMGQQALVDFGLGALGELAPVVYRAIKGTKLAKQAGNIVDAAADGATATTKSTGATVLKKTAKEQQNEYLEELADQIKNVDKQKGANNARTVTDGRRTQSNKRVQNTKAVIRGEVENMNKALDSEYDELINEYAEVAGMTPDEFVEWKANKNAPDAIVNPETGEAIPNPAKQTGNTTVDPTTGETIPNTAKAAQEGAEKAVEGAEKSAAEAFEEGDLTPESKKKVYDAVQKRTGVKIVEEEFTGKMAKSNGYYQDGVIHININSKQPKYTVLKHELTHYMQTSKNYDAFSNFIFDALKRKGFDIDNLRAEKISSYAESGVNLSKQDADFELVAEYCGEFLFNSQKSIDRLAREHYNLAIWLVDWFKDTIAKIGKSDDAKFLIDAQRKYEYALRKAKPEVNGKRWNLYVKANPSEISAAEKLESGGKTEKEIKKKTNIHRGFNGDWLFETNDSKAKLNSKVLGDLKEGKTVNLRSLLEHSELWKRLDGWNINHAVDNYRVDFKELADGAGGEISYDNKLISINSKTNYSDDDILNTLLHEVQHAVQKQSGLPAGSTREFYDRLMNVGKFPGLFPELKEYEKTLHTAAISTMRAQQILEKLFPAIKNQHIDFGSTTLNTTAISDRLNLIDDTIESIKKSNPELAKKASEAMSEELSKAKEAIGNAQNTEMFDFGFNNLDFNKYMNTAGEKEARDVASRRKMTVEQRKDKLPVKSDKNTVRAEDYENIEQKIWHYSIDKNGNVTVKGDKWFSTGENVIKDPDLKKTSQNLYGEKGNKYLQTASEATAKSANTELPKSGAKAEDKLPTKNGKKQTAASGKAKSVSADAKNPESEMTYEQASRRYETYKNGTPKKLPAKGDVSKAADTIIGSDVIGDEMREAIKENVSNYVKVTKTNRTTIDNVAAKIDSDGLENSISSFRDTLAKKNRFNEEDIAMGAEILRRLDDLGDYERALDITDDLVEMMSQAGRTLQAANIFTSMTPYGKLRSIKRAAAKMSERYGKNVEVDEDLMKELFEAKDSAKADKIKQRIFEDLWNQVPSSLMEKLDALRYTAMLSSPKTHIRNILGNAAMYVGKSLSDGVEAVLEKTVLKGKMEKLDANRTKSFLNPFSKSDRELKKKAGEIFESVKEQLMNGSSKYIEKGDVRPQNSRIFKSKTLEAGRKIVSGTLEWEDEKFMKANFQAAFAKICKANGLEVGELTARELRQYTAYAAEQAQAATFRDPNALASAMNKVYRWANDTSKSDAVGKLGRGLVKATMDATVPFRRTPANILKQAWRYSPGGVAEGMTRIVAAKDAESLLKGIEILSNGVVGTPIVLAGAYLGYQGIVTGSVGDYSDKKTTYDKMLGDQDYAVNTKKLGELFNVNIGDTTITMDWLSPYSMPFFVGTELGTALSNQEGLEGLTATQLVDAMASITEPFLEMSMMQGVQDLITQSYDGNAVEVMATNQMKTYVTQFVPTLLSQIAKTVAEEKTTTKTVNDGTVAGKSFASTIAQLKSKVPGLYETNQPDVDVWGRTETKEDVWDYVRAGVRNILSPANVKDINITDVDKEILSVYDSLDDDKATVIPTVADSSVTYKGVDYKMTDEELTAYKKDVGKYRYNGLNKLFKTSKYKNSSVQEKAKMITDVYSEANDVAKKSFLISSGNMTEEEYNATNITSKAATKLISSGKTTATKVTEAKGVLEDAGVEKAVLQAYVLDGRYDKNTMRAVGGYTQRGTYKISDTAISKAQGVKKAGLGLTQLQNAYVKADKDGSSTITKEEATSYLNKTGYSQAQKRALFAAIITNSNTHNPY